MPGKSREPSPTDFQPPPDKNTVGPDKLGATARHRSPRGGAMDGDPESPSHGSAGSMPIPPSIVMLKFSERSADIRDVG